MDSPTFCNTEVELGSATVYSHSSSDSLQFAHDTDCKVTFVAKNTNWKLMLQFEMLDIPDFLYNGVCTDGVYIYDDSKISGRTFVSIIRNPKLKILVLTMNLLDRKLSLPS